MSNYIYEYHPFVTEHDRPNSFLDFFVFDLEDVRLGLVIMAIQTNLPLEKFKAIKHIVRDNIENYATTTKPLASADAFEKVFAQINNQAKIHLNTADLGKINSILIYLKDKSLHFSLHGDFKFMMIRKNRLFDIIKMTYGLPPIDYDKLFARMYSGDIIPGDGLLISTSESWDCFDSGKIPEIFSKLPTEGAAEFLKNYLPSHSPHQLGGMIINLPAEKPKENFVKKTFLSPSESINELLQTEVKTSQWLSPTPWNRFKKIDEIITLFRNKLKLKKTGLKTSTPAVNISEKKYLRLAKILRKIKKIIPTIANLPLFFIRKKTNLNLMIRPKYKTPTKINEHKNDPRSKNSLSKILNWPKTFFYNMERTFRIIKKWPARTKWLFMISLLLIIAFSQSLTYLSNRNDLKKQTSNLNQTIEEIERLHTQANQATIFKDYSRARSLLLEANNLISQLPTDNKTGPENKQKLLADNEKYLGRANRLTIIPLPLEFTDLNEFFSENPNRLVLHNERLYVADQKILVSFDINSSEKKKINLGNISSIEHILVENPENKNSGLLILHDASNITMLNVASEELTPLNNTIEVNKNNIVDVAVYNTWLYRLDINNNQIWRHLRSANSFQSGQAWLQLPNDLSHSQSLAIDGLIYLIDKNSGLIQFNQGLKTTWQAEELDPPINNSQKISTSPASKYLYLLDPDNQRVVVYEKNGTFLQQITSPKFENLQDFAVTEKDNRIFVYLLNGSRINLIQFEL